MKGIKVMRKTLTLIALLFTVFILSSCEEITDDFNKEQEPSIELKSEGELIQIYEDGQALEDVLFSVEFKKFTENNINLNNVEVNWIINGQKIAEHKNKTSITLKVNSPGETTVKVEVKFIFEGVNKVLEQNSLISVVRTPTQIIVENSVDKTKNNVSVTIGENTNVTFTGTITGNLNHPIIKWVILKETSGEPVLVEEIPITFNDLVIVGKKGTATLNYNFTTAGNFNVSLQTGEGYTQDANKYISNTTHINVNFGLFEITTIDNKVMNTTTEIKNRLLVVNELNKAVVGDGVYKWYLNGIELDNDDNTTLTHTDQTLGGYLYQVKYFPNSDPLNPIETNPFLVVNGVLVDDEVELLEALENKVKGIILTDDIDVTTTNNTVEGLLLLIDYGVTIYGNGKTLTSDEVSTFIKVKANNVNIANLTLNRSNKYSLHIETAENIYLENLKINEFGNTNLNELLSGNFNAGVYVDRSKVVINDIEFLTGAMVGIRIDQHLEEGLTVLKLYGDFIYNTNDPILLPVGSGKSSLKGVEFIASGFDYFALPAGDITIRRWDNVGKPISWEIYDPLKIEYNQSDFLDLFGIGINIDISFLKGFEISGESGLTFVKLYIEIFKQYGKIEIFDLEDEETILKKYYIVGNTKDETVYGEDRLIYSESKDLNTDENPVTPIKPTLPNEKGQYKIKIYIGEEFYLGYIIITVE